MTSPSFDMVRQACEAANVKLVEPALLRDGENVVWKVNGTAVVRIGRVGQLKAARREVDIASWLAAQDFPTVRPIDGIAQPIEIAGRPATFWVALPSHRTGTVKDVALLLRRLHDLPLPTEFDPGQLQPFVRLKERIDECTLIAAGDRAWLLDHLARLQGRWAARPEGLPLCMLHGDAWVGNVAVDAAGHALMLDLERAAVGPPEWDLVSTAIKVSSFGWVSERGYREFVEIYGRDVMTWSGFSLLRDIRELRMTTYVLQKATGDERFAGEAQFRVDCLRGRLGPRPWAWRPSG